MRKKLWGGIAIISVIAGVAGIASITLDKAPSSSAGRGLDLFASDALSLNISAPDVLIRSKSLSRLPADLLRVPLLHDLLTEDFLFYYENGAGRLGLSGTFRRIAYEHDVTLTDELFKLVLDEPADVAIWRGGKGSLKYYAIAMTRNKLAKLLEPAAKIALNDRQLSIVGELSVEGDTVQLYMLEYALNRRLLLASHGDRVVLFSDPGMLLTSKGELNSSADDLLGDLLGADKSKQQRFAKVFDLDESANDHSIAIKADFLSFSYQHFFPALKALRFDLSEQSVLGEPNWSTAVLLDIEPARAATLLDAHTLWSSLPYQPSACVAIPIDWRALAKAMNSQTVINTPADQLATQFEGSAAVCWYAKSRMHTPLLVAQLSKEEGADAMLSAYFNYSIQGSDTEEGAPGVPVKATTRKAGDVVWQSLADESDMQPTLARSGKLVYFSPDAALVEQALSVAHKRQPAISDNWEDSKSAANAMAVIVPGQLAQLAEHEVEFSLSPQQDAVLHSAAEQHLLPKLAAVKNYSPMRLEIHDTPKGAGWTALDWRQY